MTTTDTTPTTDATAETSVSATTHEATIDGYFRCWNTSDPDERAALVERVYAPDAHLVDPLVDVQGHEALVELFGGFHVTYAGHSFRRCGGIDGHHDLVRWGWEMIDADGTTVLDGIDAALIGEDGRINFVAGFFGADLPTA